MSQLIHSLLFPPLVDKEAECAVVVEKRTQVVLPAMLLKGPSGKKPCKHMHRALQKCKPTFLSWICQAFLLSVTAAPVS